MIHRLRQLRLLGRTLSGSYPWCYRIGEWLRVERPDWVAEFDLAEPTAARVPMRQAADHALLDFCERDAARVHRLLAERFFPVAPPYLTRELLNTLSWYASRLSC